MITQVLRSALTPRYAFTVQTQAPAGNWVEILGTNDKQGALATAEWHEKRGSTVRIVDEGAFLASEAPESEVDLRKAKAEYVLALARQIGADLDDVYAVNLYANMAEVAQNMIDDAGEDDDSINAWSMLNSMAENDDLGIEEKVWGSLEQLFPV